jgi:hypothetical protein
MSQLSNDQGNTNLSIFSLLITKNQVIIVVNFSFIHMP